MESSNIDGERYFYWYSIMESKFIRDFFFILVVKSLFLSQKINKQKM